MAISPGDIFRAACPRCKKEKVSEGLFRMKRECPHCGLNLHPESGYYLGAMMAAFLITAGLMIPVIILLKISGAEPASLITVPLVLYIVFSPVITHFAKIFWLHLEYNVADRWDREQRK